MDKQTIRNELESCITDLESSIEELRRTIPDHKLCHRMASYKKIFRKLESLLAQVYRDMEKGDKHEVYRNAWIIFQLCVMVHDDIKSIEDSTDTNPQVQ